jgi:hypothetical protein
LTAAGSSAVGTFASQPDGGLIIMPNRYNLANRDGHTVLSIATEGTASRRNCFSCDAFLDFNVFMGYREGA